MARPDPVGDRKIAGKPLGWGLRISAFALLLPLGALTACGGDGDLAATSGGVPTPASGADGAASTPPAPSAPAPSALGTTSGFTPLPSPQQVIDPLGKGRQDPFAPLPLPQAGPGSSLPSGFLFTGVIQSRGLTQAIVQLGGSTAGAPSSGSSGAPSQAGAPTGPTSATLCVGPRGICPGASPSDYQLPAGWSVTGIDLRQGLLSLRQGDVPLRLPIGCGNGAAPSQAAGSLNPCPANQASANSASASQAAAANSPVAAPTPAGQTAGSPQTPSGR